MWHVLYIEDEENDVFFMRRAFQRAGQEASLKVVTDGQAAVDYLSGRGLFANRERFPLPTVVVLDLNLPIISGFQVLKWIRQQPGLQHLPVVIFSSSARPEDRLQARKLGVSEYLEKPDSGLEFGMILELLRQRWFEQCQVLPPCPRNSGLPNQPLPNARP